MTTQIPLVSSYPFLRRLLILSVASSGILLLLASAASAAGTFDDDDGSTHEANIEWMVSEGITNGCNPPTNDLFCPDDPVTRGQMATFLTRALDLKASNTDIFDDDNGNTHEKDIQALAAKEITNGCNPPANNLFCPDDPVTRGQMATFLTRALDLKASNTDTFDDDNGNTHEKDIQALAAKGITKGCNPPANNLFCPDDPVTRGEMATFLKRALAPNVKTSVPGSGGSLLSASCVDVIGFSQTNQWFTGGGGAFEDHVPDSRWQALIQGGGAIDRWIDPGFKGWTNPVASRCTSRSSSPDVVMMTITGGNRSVSAWVDAIEDMLDTIATKVPSAEHVILQPIVGGPNEQLCPFGGEDVRASENHPVIDAAIAQVAADRPNVSSGASPEVGSCSHYIDEIGHLTPQGESFVANQLGEFYADFLN